MTVLEFCNARGIQTQRVLRYISRNESIFAEHTKGKGQNMLLDDEALEILEAKYRVVDAVTNQQEIELLNKIDKLQQLVIKLQQDIISKDTLIAEASVAKLLLEEKTQKIEELENLNVNLSEKVSSLEKEKYFLENRSFFQRLLNKKEMP